MTRDHLASPWRRRHLEREHALLVARALLESPDRVHPRVAARSAPGDEQRLRHIPVIGSVGGAIPGTRADRMHEA